MNDDKNNDTDENELNAGQTSDDSVVDASLEDDIEKLMAGRKLGADEEVDEFSRDADLSIDGNLASLTKELADTKGKYLRALADLDNVQKRAIKERSEFRKYEGENIFREFLPIVDNFERALETTGTPEQLREGVELIFKMFQQCLDKFGVRGESALGQPFDPKHHEAISQLPSAEHEPGSVMNELEKVFFFKDKLLRPAKVVVAAAMPEASSQQEGKEEDQ